MFDAGSAVFTLAGHVVRSGFEQYGRLVEQARVQKEHRIVLSADTKTTGFEKFTAAITGTKQKVADFAVTTKGSMGEVSAATDKAAVAAGRGLGTLSETLGRASEKMLGMGTAARETAAEVSSSNEKMVVVAKATADAVVAENEKIIVSEKEVERAYRNPVRRGPPPVPPGGGGGGGGPGGEAERQATRTSNAWKKGFQNLAGIGKWATLGLLGVGAISVKTAADFQRNMTLLHTQANYATKDVQRLSKEVLELAPKVGVGPNELAKSLYHVASAGIDASSAMNVVKLSAEAAKVGMANTEDVTNAVVAVWKSAPKDIHSLNEAVGVMNDIVGQGNLHWEDLSKALTTGVVAAAKNAHIGLRDLGSALDVMTSRGIPAEQAATRLRTTLTLMAAPTGKAAAALAQLHMSQSQLAQDMEHHGLSYALDDLQKHLNATFPPGRKLTVDQERKALTDYGNSLYGAGERGKKLTNDIAKFKHQLDQSGDSAIKQSQLITAAFGGSRMGTTMALLVQNADDVRKHFGNLNRANAAGRFQDAWKETQKDFSVRVSQMWAGIQKLAIQIGDYLIPKLEAMVKWLIHAWGWLEKHKTILNALAILFGTLLVASITAFFARLVAGAVKSTIEIGKFAASIRRLPGIMAQAATKSIEWLGKVWSALRRNKTAAEEANAASAEGGAGGAAGGAERAAGGTAAAEGGLAGMVEGMIEGVRGALAPGSIENPLAVVVMASEEYGVGSRGAAAEEKTATSAEAEASQAAAGAGQGAATEGAVAAEGAAAAPAAEGAVAAEGAGGAAVAGEAAAGGGLLAGAGAAVLPAAIGVGVGSMAQGALGMRGGTAGTLGGGVVGGALGFAIGGPIGAAIGAGVGSTLGPTVAHAIGSVFGSPDLGKKAVSGFSKGFGGADATQFKKTVEKLINQGKDAATGAVKASKYEEAGRLVAKQLEAGWNQYKFQDEPTMFKQLKSEIGRLPPYAKYAASSSAIEFARELEASGRLPKGAAQKMLNDVEKQFPGFTKYMGLTAHSSVAAFTAALNLQRAEGNVKTSLKRISGDFPQVSAAMKAAGGTVVQQSNAAVKALQKLVKDGSGPASAQAAADLRDLRNKTLSYFQSMDASVTANISDISKQVKKHSSQAASDAQTQFKKFQTSVQNAMSGGSLATDQGMRMIAQVTNQIIKAFGGTQIPVPALVHQQQLVQLFAQGKTGASALVHATGGKLPGGEFGGGDVMTLVDPLGIPRAKMAGDEAVFNRHQMPYVDMGLRMLGINGAEGLWNSVTVPHGVSVGYSRGGNLPRFMLGGPISANPGSRSGGYVFPFPKNQAFSWNRIDQGQDLQTTPGGVVLAIAPGIVSPASDKFSGFGGHYATEEITGGPLAGRGVYYGHIWATRFGRVNAGDVIGHTQTRANTWTAAPSGWLELGFLPYGSMTAGAAIAPILRALAAGHRIASGALGSTSAWQDLPYQKVSGRGAIRLAAQLALNKATDAANAYGQSQAGYLTGFTGGGNDKANEALARRMMMAMGWGADQWPALLALWTQESGFRTGATNPSSGAYGIPQSLPASKMAAAGSDWRTNPATQIAWGLRYIKTTYGSPAGAEGHEKSHNWYNRGGLLKLAVGGHGPRAARPYAPIPSSTSRLPGFRPPRVRRGASGLHVVGGSTHGGSHSSTAGSRGGSSGKVKQQGRPHQTLSQTTANTLKALGFGNFVDDQNQLGRIDAKYDEESNLFQLFDGGGGNLPLADLNILMGLRENQWDILYKEWKTLPAAIAALQRDTDALMGHTVPGHRQHPSQPISVGTGLGALLGGHPSKSQRLAASGKWIPPHTVGGVVPALTNEVTAVEDEIKGLRHDLTLDSQKIATVHHNVTQRAMNLADGYASQISGYLNDIAVIQDQKYSNSQQRITLQNQMRNLPSGSSSSANLSVSQIVSGVMSGALPSTGAATTNPAKKGLQNRIARLHSSDVSLTQSERTLRRQMAAVKRQQQSAARAYRQEGFDAAWAITLDKYRITDQIYRLQLKLEKLKDSLKKESQAGKADQNALQTLKNWESGGLQGTEAISDSLEANIYNMLELYQQGAQLPTPGRKSPTLALLESVLTGDATSKPPKGLGLVLPPGLTQGLAQASQAYTDFTAFQASRQALFSQFGSNFAGAGINPAGNSAGLGAGLQYFGAGAGPSPGAGAFTQGGYIGEPRRNSAGAGGTTVNITNNFSSGPPDAHTWSAGTMHELTAMA